MVGRLPLWEQEVPGSNPGAPTRVIKDHVAWRPDSAASLSEDAAAAVGGRQNRRFEPRRNNVTREAGYAPTAGPSGRPDLVKKGPTKRLLLSR